MSLVQLNVETKTLGLQKFMEFVGRTQILNNNAYKLHIATQTKAHFYARMCTFQVYQTLCSSSSKIIKKSIVMSVSQENLITH